MYKAGDIFHCFCIWKIKALTKMGNSQSSSPDPRFVSASRFNSQFDRSDLQAVLAAILDELFPLKDNESGKKSNQYIIDEILSAATFSKDDGEGDTKSMSSEDFKDLCSYIPSLRRYLGSLLLPPDAGGLLTPPELQEWKLLYHSSYNGMSFNTFLGNIANDEGPTLLIIKDTEGYIYGGYASQPWQKHSDFYGDLKCFLFQLHPKVSVFRPTGANNNLQWCAVNYSSESIPNGIGFGGRVHHFGLFLTANFDGGKASSVLHSVVLALPRPADLAPK
ncbi:TLD domain-containing protein 1 [Bienertia sinuspersici]